MSYSASLIVLERSRDSCRKASRPTATRSNDLPGTRRLWLERLEARVPPSSLLIGGLVGLEFLGEALTQPAAARQRDSYSVEPASPTRSFSSEYVFEAGGWATQSDTAMPLATCPLRSTSEGMPPVRRSDTTNSNNLSPADIFFAGFDGFAGLGSDFGSLLFDSADRVARVSDSDSENSENYDSESPTTQGVSTLGVGGMASATPTGVIEGNSLSTSGSPSSTAGGAVLPMTTITNTTAQSPLALVDANGAPMTATLDANTLVIGAATWCSACATFKEALAAPGVAEELAGLKFVFAFGDEGGAGVGGVQNEAFLANLPGEVAFLAAGSVRPESFPSAFNSATGQFDQSAFTAVGAWLGESATAAKPPAADALALVDANGAPLNIVLDANTLVIGSATWCGATAKVWLKNNFPIWIW